MRKPLLENRIRAPKGAIGIRDTAPVETKGDWWLVMPQTARDVFLLQILGNHEKMAAYVGEGILVSDSAIPKQQSL